MIKFFISSVLRNFNFSFSSFSSISYIENIFRYFLTIQHRFGLIKLKEILINFTNLFVYKDLYHLNIKQITKAQAFEYIAQKQKVIPNSFIQASNLTKYTKYTNYTNYTNFTKRPSTIFLNANIIQPIVKVHSYKIHSRNLFTFNSSSKRLFINYPTIRILKRSVSIIIIPSASKFIKVSGLLAISPHLRTIIRNNTLQGNLFLEKFIYNSAKTFYHLYGGKPITSAAELGHRIAKTVSYHKLPRQPTLISNFAINQHLTTFTLAEKTVDTSIIANMDNRIDYATFNQGVSPLQFLELETFSITLGHLFENKNLEFEVVAINADNSTASNSLGCYQVLKQMHNDFTITFKLSVGGNNTRTIERYFDVKTSMRPIVESLPFTKANLAVCQEFNFEQSNKKFPGHIGHRLPQLKNVDQDQFEAIKDWKIELETHLLNNKKQSPEECFYAFRTINDRILCDSRIKVMVPSYFNFARVDQEFCLVVDQELILNIKNFAHPKNVNIDLVIPEAQVVDVAAKDIYFLSIAKLFKGPIMQEMIHNYFQLKNLICI